MERTDPMTNVYPLGSIEFQPILVTRDNVVITSGVSFAVIALNTAPASADWFSATVLPTAAYPSGATGFLTGSYAAGTWAVWAKISDSPETPIINCGTFQISVL